MATRAEWAERVDLWQKSGLSAKDFAARERIESRRLVWWRWKLRSSPPEQRFLPVRVVDAAARPAGVPDSALSTGPRLRALAVYLVVFQHVPVERCRQLIADVTGAAVSDGFVHSCLAKAASLAA